MKLQGNERLNLNKAWEMWSKCTFISSSSLIITISHVLDSTQHHTVFTAPRLQDRLYRPHTTTNHHTLGNIWPLHHHREVICCHIVTLEERRRNRIDIHNYLSHPHLTGSHYLRWEKVLSAALKAVQQHKLILNKGEADPAEKRFVFH